MFGFCFLLFYFIIRAFDFLKSQWHIWKKNIIVGRNEWSSCMLQIMLYNLRRLIVADSRCGMLFVKQTNHKMRHVAPAEFVHDCSCVCVCVCQHIARLVLVILDVLPLICRRWNKTYAVNVLVASTSYIFIQCARVIFMAIVISQYGLSILSNWLLLSKVLHEVIGVCGTKYTKVHIPAKAVNRINNKRFEVLLLWSVNMWNAFEVDYIRFTLIVWLIYCTIYWSQKLSAWFTLSGALAFRFSFKHAGLILFGSNYYLFNYFM